MRVDQFVPSFVRHDAISNHALQIRRALREAGYESGIYYEWVDRRVAGEGSPFSESDPAPDPQRLIVYHASTHSSMAEWLSLSAATGQSVALDYHNITPSRYFARWEPKAAQSMDSARHELALVARDVSHAMADSPFNAEELAPLGLPGASVCPILVDYEEYRQVPDGRAMSGLARRKGQGHLWLFVGRIAPNKCQHDVVAAFALYRRLFDPRARLALVGGVTSPRYLRATQALAEELGVAGAVETVDSAPFPELLAYYRSADVFVCLSEHEGFCVPIVEAMYSSIPVVAYSAAAVTDTVGRAGVLLDGKDPLQVACAVDDVLVDDAKRGALVEAGRERADEFSLEVVKDTLLGTIKAWTGQ